jgi:hypothetical protein
LREAGLRWRGDAHTEARNQLAFHVGDAEVISKGLAKWPADTPLVFSLSDGPSPSRTTYSIGGDLLLRGLDIMDDDFERLVGEAVRDGRMPIDAMIVFIGVLHAKGAPIPPPKELEGMDIEGQGATP